MKTKRFFIATLLVVAAISVAVVSCKKETASAVTDNKNESAQTFNPREIEDMNAYLKDFKQKMNSTAKGEDESLSLEDAAWHLSSLANYDFGHANVECDNVRFDTLYAHVNVTDGKILLSDLASAYEEIHMGIDKFYHSLTLDNKHFRFINAIISENGEVAITLLTTFSHGTKDIMDHIWYFPGDVWDLCDTCYYYLPEDSYPVQTTGTSELQRVLNLIVSHNYVLISEPTKSSSRFYYTPTFTKPCNHQDYIDPYGSPNFNDSRIFACMNSTNYDIVLWICYLLDSYLGLGHQYCPDGEYILSWEVAYNRTSAHASPSMEYHVLRVTYGEKHEYQIEPGQNDY